MLHLLYLLHIYYNKYIEKRCEKVQKIVKGLDNGFLYTKDNQHRIFKSAYSTTDSSLLDGKKIEINGEIYYQIESDIVTSKNQYKLKHCFRIERNIKMVTLQHKTHNNRTVFYIEGLSTDIKPALVIDGDYLTNGSVFHEIDTDDMYKFDEENKVWIKQINYSLDGIDNTTLLNTVNASLGEVF